MRTLKMFASVATMALATVMVGCQSGGPKTIETLQPSINLSANDREIVSGEVTTLFAETANLLGRDVQVNWSTTLGQVQPINNGRMARFTSDVPGTAMVTAEINVDGQTLRDRANVTVNAIE